MKVSNEKQENFEFQVRDIGGLDVFYKRKIGDKIWKFSDKKEFELNTSVMNNKYTESDIKKGAKIELKEHKNTLSKYAKDGIVLIDFARDIAIDHLKENPNAYPNEDVISMNVPLFIRMLELAREDIKSDEELHKIVEKVIIASKKEGYLTMKDYDGFLETNLKEEDIFSNGGEAQVEKVLLAPNGNPSNLTSEQYKLVRTPEFKAWFGDWENEPENASKVVDENGEPLVLWHYSKSLINTSDKFYVFRTNNELGSHFGTLEQARKIKYKYQNKYDFEYETKEEDKSEEKSDFRYYEVFLNIKNPLKMIDKGVFDGEKMLETLEIIMDKKNYEDLYNKYFKMFRGNKHHIAKEISDILNYDGIMYLNRYESDAPKNIIKEMKTFSDEEFKKKFKEVEYSYIAFNPNQIKLADGTNTNFDSNNLDIRFSDGGKIQINSNKGKVNLKLEKYWRDDTELVPVSELLKFREFNRFERPKYSLEDSKENIHSLEKELINNGVEEPLIIEYSLEDNAVLLVEGNHRLNVAENLGFDYLPARVILRRREFNHIQKPKSMKVKGFKPDEYGYVPSNLKPSQIGIAGTIKAFEEGGIIEGQLHSECNEETGCGEKFDVGGVGHIIEAERDEAVIVSKAFQDTKEYEIKGKPSEIASALNVIGGGKNFDSGAEIKTEDGEKIKVSEIKKEAKNTDVESIDPNSIIINRRTMYDDKEYVAKGTTKQIASQINNLNDNGVKITDGGSIKEA